MKRRAVLIGSPALALPVLAAGQTGTRHEDGHLSIDLPPGYVGPVEHKSGPAVSRGFRKPYPGATAGAALLGDMAGAYDCVVNGVGH